MPRAGPDPSETAEHLSSAAQADVPPVFPFEPPKRRHLSTLPAFLKDGAKRRRDAPSKMELKWRGGGRQGEQGESRYSNSL